MTVQADGGEPVIQCDAETNLRGLNGATLSKDPNCPYSRVETSHAFHEGTNCYPENGPWEQK